MWLKLILARINYDGKDTADFQKYSEPNTTIDTLQPRCMYDDSQLFKKEQLSDNLRFQWEQHCSYSSVTTAESLFRRATQLDFIDPAMLQKMFLGRSHLKTECCTKSSQKVHQAITKSQEKDTLQQALHWAP